MKFLKTLLFFFMLFAFCSQTNAADSSHVIHFNLDNGLPANHVYRVFQDRNGYMWFGTENGVVKYDGYSFKIFNTSNGLPTSDVWAFWEDDMGRIWLGMIANEFGYIRNDEYHALRYRLKKVEKIQHVLFNGKYTYITFSVNNVLAVDSVDRVLAVKPAFNIAGQDRYMYVNIVVDTTCNQFRVEKISLKSSTLSSDTFVLTKHDISRFSHSAWVFKDGSMPHYYSKSHSCHIIRNGNVYDIGALFQKDEYVYTDNFYDRLRIITNKYLYSFSRDYKLYTKLDFKARLKDEKIQLTNFFIDNAQNNWYGTSNGVYFQPGVSGIVNHSTQTHTLTGAKYVGNLPGYTCWWKDEKNELLIMDSNNSLVLHRFFNEPISGFSISTDPVLYLQFPGRIDTINIRKNEVNEYINAKGKNTSGAYFDPNGTISNLLTLFKTKDYLYVTSGYFGLRSLSTSNDTLFYKQIAPDRYNKFFFDKIHKRLWYYNRDNILVLNPETQKSFIIDNAVLSNLGIISIITLDIDRHLNLYIQHSDKLTIFNCVTLKFRHINTNLKLVNARLCIARDRMFVATEAGLAWAPIKGPLDIGTFHIMVNAKNNYYKAINDFAINGNTLILQTDKGAFTTTVDELSSTDLIEVSDKNLVQFVVHTPDAYNLNNTDTISISDSTERIRLDMINLYGKGTKNYFYNIDHTGWQKAPTGEIFFPHLQPGYHTVQCYGTDELWKSNINTFHLYKQPYWYQTSKWKTIFWISGIILFLGIVLIAVLITRYLVQRANDKKRQTLELELRAIHSQINPHFIFNTLGTALFFISKHKMNEAYQHVHKFSRLLRSYLKASHDRYTLLSEEIEMLRNYIELQQIRFEEKVDYIIEIDNRIPAGSIMVPSLLFQPLVENAINHGLFHLEDGRKGKLKIIFRQGKNNNEIICMIDDNGIGRKRAKELREQSELKRDSYGTKLTQDLIDIFKGYERMDIYIEYTDKEAPDTGTIVTLTIKNLKYVA